MDFQTLRECIVIYHYTVHENIFMVSEISHLFWSANKEWPKTDTQSFYGSVLLRKWLIACLRLTLNLMAMRAVMI